MSRTFSGRIQKPDGILMRELGGEAVLLNLDTESYFGLDETGTRMWTLLDSSATIQAAYSSLLAEYDVAPEDLGRDLARFLAELAEAGLIRVVDE